MTAVQPSSHTRTSAKKILAETGIDGAKRPEDLIDDEINAIRNAIDQNYAVEGDLRREVAQNIKRYLDLGCYRGIRHRRGLPVRGQRTHTNARTRKGPRRIVTKRKGK